MKNKLSHPCKQTCSGWLQGFEEGRKEIDQILEALKKYHKAHTGDYYGSKVCDADYENEWDFAEKVLKEIKANASNPNN